MNHQLLIQSFEFYFNSCYSQAYGYIMHKISDEYTAEDLLMESFLSCYKKFEEFDPQRASFQTWLYVVINNKLKNYYRDRKQFDDIDDCMEFADSFEDDIIAAEQLNVMKEVLAKALETVSETQRKIVLMRYFENLPSKEIGAHLGLTDGNVRVQLTRALNIIRTYFESNNINWEF